MKIVENSSRVRCELGACKNRATHAVALERVGLRGRLYMCEDCMNALYTAIGEVVVPKSVETAKQKRKRVGRGDEA